MYIDRNEIVSSICRDSLWEFVKEFWEVLNPDEAPIWNWHVPYICRQLQVVAERVMRKEDKKYDLIINIPPGTTKSTVCSIMFPAWMWTRMPSAKMICGSYAFPLALDLSRKCRDIIRSSKYQMLFPHVQLSEDQDTKGYFTTTAKGGRVCIGTAGSITGFHAHIIIIDDPIDPKGAASAAIMKTAIQWIWGTLSTRKVEKRVTPIVLIMQRLHQNDPTGDWLERVKADTEGVAPVKHICLPCELSDKVKPKKVAEKYVEGLLDCKRLSREVLAQTRAQLGPIIYAGQFEQNPIPAEGGLFKTEMIEIGVPPAKMVHAVRYWDKAGTEGAGCFSVGVKMGVDKEGTFWVLHVKRGQWSTNKREREILKTAQMDGVDVEVVVEQEPGSGGKESAESTIRRLAGYVVSADRPTGEKTTRWVPFSVQVNEGNVKMAYGAWNEDFLTELAYGKQSKYRDQLDASSGAFSKLAFSKRRIGAL